MPLSSCLLVETRAHDISALVSGFHIYFDQSGIICGKTIILNTEEDLYQFMLVLSSLNNLSDAECRSCYRMTTVKDPNVKWNLEAAGVRLSCLRICIGGLTAVRWEGELAFSVLRRVAQRNTSQTLSTKIGCAVAFEILLPIRKLTDIKSFMSAYRDIFQVVHLWQNNIARRGISVGNLMDANEKVACGVLCDWDLAEVDNVSSKSLFRTGTHAFLAMDLLHTVPPPHIERFDWESALYILIWITTQYEDEKEKHTGALTQWLNHKDTIAFSAKLVYIYQFYERPELKAFKLLHRYWIDPWTVLFRNGFQARNALRPWEPASESFDDETLGGHVTYEKIWAFLMQDLVEDDS